MFLMTTLVLIQVPYGRLSLASVPGTAPVRFKVPLPMVAIVPVVRPLTFCPGSDSFTQSPGSPFTQECDDDGWSDYNTDAIARPRSASQSLASELRLNLSVAGAFAESEDASPSGPQNSTDANLPKDESNCVDHAITPCHAHANPAEDTHASSAMNLKPQCTSAVEPTACKRLWRFTAHQCAGWWQHLSC